MAGKRINSATTPATKMVNINHPKRCVGVKVLNAKTDKPSPLMHAACSVGVAHRLYDAMIDSLRFLICFTSTRNQERKWIVLSTATPSAMLADIIEPISIGMLSQPIAPKMMKIGNTLGIIATKPARMLRETNIISGVMVTE